MLIAVGVCLVYTAACVSLGAALMGLIGVPRVKWHNFSAAALVATALLLGQGLLGNLWLVLGLAGKFSVTLIIGLLGLCLLIGAVVVRRELGSLSRELWHQLIHHLSVQPASIRLVAVLALMMVALLGMFNAILPVRFGSGDGIFFYMVLPKVMAASGRVLPVSGYEYTHSISGFVGEMHHAALLALSGEQAALLYVWVTAVSMLALLVGLCGHLGVGRIGKWVAVAMMLSSTTVSFYLIDGKVDLFAAAMGMAALYWVLHADGRDARVKAVCLAGLFTGFSVVAKATYVLAVALPVVALLFWNRSLGVRQLALFIGFAVLPFLPHCAKNIMLFREPLAPFLFLDPQTGAAYRSQGYWNTPMVVRQILLTYPLALTYGDHTFQYGNISGLYVALGPLTFFVSGKLWRRHARLVRFTVVILTTVIIAAFLQASYFAPRFILPALLALIPAIAFAAENVFRASSEHIWFRAVIVSCVVIALIGYSTVEQDFKRLLRYRLHGSGVCDIEGFPLPECHDMLALNEMAALGDRIFTSNSYTFWLRTDLIQCLSNTDERQLLSGSENRLEQLYDLGFRYVENTGEAWDLTRVPDWLSVSSVYKREAVGLSNAVQIYEMKLDEPSRRPRFACRQAYSQAWEVVKLEK